MNLRLNRERKAAAATSTSPASQMEEVINSIPHKDRNKKQVKVIEQLEHLFQQLSSL